jgi:hypothetical protein
MINGSNDETLCNEVYEVLESQAYFFANVNQTLANI